MTNYGKKGGAGPTKGQRATTYLVMLPDGKLVRKRVFHNFDGEPTGYAYQHAGQWYLAAVNEPDCPRFSHYTQCPASPL